MHIIHREEYGTIGIRGDTRRNIIDPATATIVAGLGSSLLGGIFGGSSQKDTNKTNLQIARETNEQNYKIWQEQKAHNIDMFNMENQANIDMFNMENQAAIDMWNMQNAYNDPSAQAERLLKAGYNPLMALGSGAAGNSTSAPSVGSLNSATAQPAQAPTMQNPAPITSPFQTAWNNAMQGVQTMVESISKAALTQPTIDNLNAGTNLATQQAVKTHFEGVSAKAYSEYAPTIFAEQAEQIKYQNDILSVEAQYAREAKGLQLNLLRADLAYKGLSIEAQQILNSFLPGEKQLDMMTKGQVYCNLWLDGKIKEKDVDNYFWRYIAVNQAQAAKLWSEKKGQDIKNESDQMDLDAKKAYGQGSLNALYKSISESSKMQALLSYYNSLPSLRTAQDYEEQRKDHPYTWNTVERIGFLGEKFGSFLNNLGFSASSFFTKGK